MKFLLRRVREIDRKNSRPGTKPDKFFSKNSVTSTTPLNSIYLNAATSVLFRLGTDTRCSRINR